MTVFELMAIWSGMRFDMSHTPCTEASYQAARWAGAPEHGT